MSEVILYTTEDGKTKVDLRLEDGTVWLTQLEIAELFQTTKNNISTHTKHIFEDGELTTEATVKESLTVQTEGNREVTRTLTYYNLDLILAVGYRVRSPRGVEFRRWASTILKEYLEKGFALNDDRLKNLGGGNYWKELLERIRDIRSSEKVMYRQVLDLYATATDYHPKSEESLQFFKIVQNKLHYAAHGHTASEVIYLRVDHDQPFAGLSNFKGSQPTQAEAMIAKNYLSAPELRVLNNLVSAYFDLAEINAIEEREMRMSDSCVNSIPSLVPPVASCSTTPGKSPAPRPKKKPNVNSKNTKPSIWTPSKKTTSKPSHHWNSRPRKRAARKVGNHECNDVFRKAARWRGGGVGGFGG